MVNSTFLFFFFLEDEQLARASKALKKEVHFSFKRMDVSRNLEPCLDPAGTCLRGIQKQFPSGPLHGSFALKNGLLSL